MFEKISAFFMSIIVFLLSTVTPAPPDAVNPEEIRNLSDITEEIPISDTIYVLDSGMFANNHERITATLFQGIVAKKMPSVYITSCSLDSKYLNAFQDMGHKISRTDENGDKWTLGKLIEKLRSYITDSGYILYNSENRGSLNIATNYATLEGWLPVSEETEALAINAGLSLKKDISRDNCNTAYQWMFFEQNKNRFSDKAVIHQSEEVTGLRDIAIQQGFFTFFCHEDMTAETLFRKRVLSFFGDNTHILGWAIYEVAFVDSISKEGNMVSPADHAHNNSILSSVRSEDIHQTAVKNTYTDPTKHYVALVMSDGDNIQWIQNGFSEYFRKISLTENFPMTWSFPPLLADLSPLTAQLVYSAAGENNYFISGVSGAGYIHPTQYPEKALAGFTDITAAAMLQSDMKYVQILDKTPENAAEEFRLTSALRYYTRYDNIEGGILSLDPARYAGGHGKVYFVDGKPFLTYRMSLWHPSGNMQEVTKDWLRQQADIINSYPADINSINGYSVINIHPWTISTESLSYFVSCLDEDITLVTADEIMEMISNNIPKENASPIN